MASKSTGPIKVFLDRNVIARSMMVEGAVRRQRIEWGSTKEEVEISGWRKKPPRDGDTNWIADEVACLPTVARLAKDGTIALFESNEVSHEAFKARDGIRGIKGDIFAKTPIARVDDAVDRSYFKWQTIEEVASRTEMIDFCQFLREIELQQFEKIPEFCDRLPETMQANLRKLGRFHELLDALPTERHWPDAFHLWTAETHGADYFLTLDKKFVNALTKTARIDLPTKPASPSKLLDDLNVVARDPFPIEDLEFYSYSEMLD